MTPWRLRFATLLAYSGLAVSSVACGGASRPAEGIMRSDEVLKADLDLVRDARILFGHQSVGANVLDGVKELTDRLRVPPLRVVAGAGPAAATPVSGFLADVRIGRNGDPSSKFEAFRAAAGGAASRYDVVTMKLCYADFGAASDPVRVSDAYRGVIASLRAEPASPVVLHITTPLRTMTPGWKLLVKRLLRSPEDTRRVENAKRAEYSTLLRRTFSGEPLFDLAAVESGLWVETPLAPAADSDAPPALLDRYTDDGGHLNAEGRSVAARAFVHALADAVRAVRARTAR